METQRPRLRRDLEFTHRQTGDTTEVIVCDPLTSRYFRASELEGALFALLAPISACSTCAGCWSAGVCPKAGGAVIPGLAAMELPPPAVRRAAAALARGHWGVGPLQTCWQ